VLLDLLLPGVPEDAIQDDLQALRAVRREVRAPIIVFSGLEAETLPQKALIQGAFAFVSKLAVNGELPPLLAAAFTGVVPADLRGKQDAALVSTMQQMAGVQDDLVVTIHGKTRIPINGALRELGLSRMYLALRREVLWGIVFAAVAGAIAGAIVSAVISAVLTL
jgi:FixJ family two-component response regulator